MAGRIEMKRRMALAGLAALGLMPGALAQTANPRKPIYPDTKNTVGESLEEIREKGRIKIAVYEDFRPFSFIEDGELIGIDVDIAKAIAKGLDLRLELMAVQADETVDADLRNHVWRGPRIGARSEGSIAIDAVANLMLHIPYNKELDIRNELAVLFSPYFEDRVIIARDPEQFEGGEFSLFDLDGKPVAVELDTLSDFYLSSTWGGKLRSNVKRFRRPDDGMAALMGGNVAAFMGPLSQIEGALGDRREDYDVEPTTLPGLAIDRWKVGAAVRENARDLRWEAGDIIDAMVRNGEMAGIFSHYGVNYRSPTA
jgi:ABC-type amino acid transport substrate-binding protein